MSAETVAKALWAAAKRSSGGWLTRCPLLSHGNGQGDRHPSLLVTDGERRTLFKCFGGCSSDAVAEEIGRRGVHDEPHVPRLRTNSDNAEYASHLWARSQPAEGSPVETYLHHRGLEAPVPKCLRYAPRLRYDSCQAFPAMVAAVQDAIGSLIGVHRTWLREDGRGKASVSTPKKGLGSTRHGAVHLTPAQSVLILCEGIEDGQALRQLTSNAVWPVLGTAGFGNVELPANVRTVILAPDPDKAGKKVIEGAAERFQIEGRRVLNLRAPAGLDWCDALSEFSERAAMAEFEGHLSRPDAEELAYQDIFRWEVSGAS